MTARVLRQAPLKSLAGLPKAASTELLGVPVGKAGTLCMLVVAIASLGGFLLFFGGGLTSGLGSSDGCSVGG